MENDLRQLAQETYAVYRQNEQRGDIGPYDNGAKAMADLLEATEYGQKPAEVKFCLGPGCVLSPNSECFVSFFNDTSRSIKELLGPKGKTKLSWARPEKGNLEFCLEFKLPEDSPPKRI